jgi:hypothetical protein
MRFVKGTPKPVNGGRKKGGRNKRTIAAEAYPDALAHIRAVMEAKDDPLITPDLKLRAAIALAQYQHSKPTSLKAVEPVDYAPPQTVEESRAALLELGGRLAKGEIPVELHDALVNGIRAWLADHTAEQERRLSALENALRGDSP